MLLSMDLHGVDVALNKFAWCECCSQYIRIRMLYVDVALNAFAAKVVWVAIIECETYSHGQENTIANDSRTPGLGFPVLPSFSF